MKKLFIDTNILIDLIADRRPFSKFAIEIFRLSEQKKVKLFCSSHSIATTHYIMKKYSAEKELRNTLLTLFDYLTIIPIDADILKRGLRSKHKDFEDAIQIIAAESIDKMEGIITRNPKDFKHAEIPVYAPDEIVDLF